MTIAFLHFISFHFYFNFLTQLNAVLRPPPPLALHARSMMVGSLTMSLGVFLSSFSKKLSSFLLTYCVLFGLGTGLCYTSPIVAGWRHLPEKKGLVSGCVLGGFGLGGFVFNMVGSALSNPKQLSLDPETKLFPEEVYANFSPMLRKLSLIYAAMQLTGAALMKLSKIPPAPPKSNGPSDRKLITCIFSRDFLLLWTCIVLSSTAGLNTVSVYKMFGNQHPSLKSDTFLAAVGGVGSVANGVGRTGWGALQDKLGFRKLFTGLTLIQATTTLMYRYTVHSRPLFTFATMVLFCCLGGNFAMAPGACAKLFGAQMGPKVFAVLFSGFATAAIGGSALNKALMSSGFSATFKVMAFASVAAAALVTSLGDV